MLRIRLSRIGKTNYPHYSVVVTEKTNPAIDGNFLEKLGTYSPVGPTPSFSVDLDRSRHWISKGARPTDTVARLLQKQGLEGMDRFVDFKKQYQIQNEKTRAAAAAAAEAAAKPAAAPAPESAPEPEAQAEQAPEVIQQEEKSEEPPEPATPESATEEVVSS
ncbi:MAG: 30S ribosomal protein S16 [bacterium]|nr:30S ribosomal protein S16 [bacterium]